MTTHEIHQFLPPSELTPITEQWLIATIAPTVMARMLVGWMQQSADVYGAILDLERKCNYERQAGPLDPAKVIGDIHSLIAQSAAAARTQKFRDLALMIEPIWNSSRHSFKNNPRWAESTLERPEIVDFMNRVGFRVKVDAVAGWAREYGWNPEAKKKPVS